MSRIPTDNIDYTSRDYESFKADMIETLKANMPEYTDTSETDAGIVILEALANGLDILSLYLDSIANDVFLPTTQDRKTAVVLAKGLGYTPYNQGASEYPQVFVKEYEEDEEGNRIKEGLFSEEVVIPKGSVVTTVGDDTIDPLYFETQEELIIPANAWGDEKNSDGEYLYKVTIRNLSRVSNDNVGVSKGTPFQSFDLSYLYVLDDTVEVYVQDPEIIADSLISDNEDTGSDENVDPTQKPWTKVDSFVTSGAKDKHYMITIDEFDTCYIEFGNGVNGMIPPKDSVIICNYAIGGGSEGNVDAGSITEIDDIGDSSFEGTTFNLEATKLGYDKEDLDSIKINAPANFKSRGTLITEEDYTTNLNIKFPNVFRDIYAHRLSNNERHLDIYYDVNDSYAQDIVYELPKNVGVVLKYTIANANNVYVPSTYMVDSVTYPVIGVICSSDGSNTVAKVYIPSSVRFVEFSSVFTSKYVYTSDSKSNSKLGYIEDNVSVTYSSSFSGTTTPNSYSMGVYFDEVGGHNIEIPDEYLYCYMSNIKTDYIHTKQTQSALTIYAHPDFVYSKILYDYGTYFPKFKQLSPNSKTIGVQIGNEIHEVSGQVLSTIESQIRDYLDGNIISGTSYSLIPCMKQSIVDKSRRSWFKVSVAISPNKFTGDDSPVRISDSVPLLNLIEASVESFFINLNLKIGEKVIKSSLESFIKEQIEGVKSVRIVDSTSNPLYGFIDETCVGEVLVKPHTYIYEDIIYIEE